MDVARPASFDSGWPSDPMVNRDRLCYYPLHVVAISCVALAGYGALALGLYEPDASHGPIAVVCGLAVMGLIAYVRFVLRLPWVSASMMFLVLFWTFHFGRVFTGVLVPEALASFPDRELAWMYWPNVRLTMILSLIGATAFVLGVGLMAAPRAGRAEASGVSQDPAMHAVGWVVMLGAIGGLVFVLMRSGGLGVLEMSYSEFRSASLGPVKAFVDLSQIGCVLAICGAPGRRWIWPIAAWAPVAGAMLLVGIRNEAMIPLVTFAILLTHRGVRLNRGLLAAGVVAALVVVPAVKSIRAVGFSNRTLVNWTEMSPLSTFTELGGTLRAAKAYVDWIDQGDDYLLGAGYWAPVDRHFLAFVIPGRARLPIQQDRRVPFQRMFEREGGVGASATGEAYYNFGPIGPFIYFLCVGLLFGGLERKARTTPWHSALLAVVVFAFYWNIRGQWISLPAQVASGVAVLGLSYVLSRLWAGRAVTPASVGASGRSEASSSTGTRFVLANHD